MNPIRLATVVLTILGGVELLQARPAKLELRPTPQSQTATAPSAAKEPQSVPQAPVFRAGVELVRLDIRVVDEEGRPVKDLKPEEVVVEEAGQTRPIVLFQHVAEPAGTYLEAARQTIGAEVSTNQGAPRGHLYVFVFDQNHITPGNEQRARMAVERFLRTRVRRGDKVALYAMPGPGPQLGFSSNTSLALAELPKVRGMLDREVGTGISAMSIFEAYQITRGDLGVTQRVLARSTESATGLDLSGRAAAARAAAAGAATGSSGSAGESFTQAQQIVVDSARTVVGSADSETRAFLYSLSDVIRQLSSIEGRKSVILVSEGFYADNVSRDVDRVAAAAAEAYAVIYSLDINRRGLDVSAGQPSGGDPASEIQSRLESLGALSAETSGQLVLDSNGQMEQVLARIADSSQDYYLVGFEPPAAALGDRHDYRRVKVRVTRTGARAMSRTGYALREPVSPADRRRSIDAALAAPFPQQGLPLAMTTYVLRGASPGAQRVFMSLQAQLPVATSQSTTADIVFVVRQVDNGRVMASGTDVLPLPSTGQDGRTTAPGRFHVQFDLPAGEYLMRAVVREPGGTAGTVDRRFAVRALDGVDMTASDLIIGRRQDRLPVRPAGYVDEGLAGAMEIYARRPSDLEDADVTIDLFQVGSDSPLRSVKADLGDTRPVSGGAARAANIAMPLTGVEPGEYVARATLRGHGETVTEVMRQVEVLPGRAPAGPASLEERVTPLMVVNGELGHRFVARIKETSNDPGVANALDAASRGAWDKVIEALPGADDGHGAAGHALRGLAFFAAARFEDAEQAMGRASALDPQSALASFFLGWIRVASGRRPEAISAWRQAVALDRTLVSAYLALADTYVKLSHPELAAQALNEGLRANPESPELRNRLDEIERR